MSRVKMKDVTCVYCNKELKIGEAFCCLKCLGCKMFHVGEAFYCQKCLGLKWNASIQPVNVEILNLKKFWKFVAKIAIVQ